jgi:hypothetical protein
LLGRFVSYDWQQKLVKRLHLQRPGLREFLIPRFEPIPYHKKRMSRHGSYSDIPEDARQLKIASIIRDPFSRYTSAYLYQMKTKKRIRHLAEPEELERLYPGYPEIGFGQFYDMTHRFIPEHYFGGVQPKIDLGAQTVAFIHFYFKDPVEVFKKIDHEYIESCAYREDMVNIRFMHQENLRSEFKAFLQEEGYSEEECSFVDTFKPRNVANRDKRETKVESFYTPELVESVLKRDALLFKIFPEYLPQPETE